jgi:hypothetical protein
MTSLLSNSKLRSAIEDGGWRTILEDEEIMEDVGGLARYWYQSLNSGFIINFYPPILLALISLLSKSS